MTSLSVSADRPGFQIVFLVERLNSSHNVELYSLIFDDGVSPKLYILSVILVCFSIYFTCVKESRIEMNKTRHEVSV